MSPSQPPHLPPVTHLQFLVLEFLGDQEEPGRAVGRKMADPEFYAKLPGLSVPYTNIAGTKGLRLGWLPLGTRLNDGLVAVDETAVEPSDQVMIVPASHTFMMNRRLVQQAVLSILDDEGSADRA